MSVLVVVDWVQVVPKNAMSAVLTGSLLCGPRDARNQGPGRPVTRAVIRSCYSDSSKCHDPVRHLKYQMVFKTDVGPRLRYEGYPLRLHFRYRG